MHEPKAWDIHFSGFWMARIKFLFIYCDQKKERKKTWNCRKCPHAGFKRLIYQYKQSIFFCSKSKILRAQPWCLALYSWKAEKRWFVRYDTSATFWPCSWCHWYRLLDTKCQRSCSQVNVFVTYNRFFNEQEQKFSEHPLSILYIPFLLIMVWTVMLHWFGLPIKAKNKYMIHPCNLYNL